MDISTFNTLPKQEMKALMISWCHSERWADTMMEQAPFKDISALMVACDHCWQRSEETDVLEAFAGHPKIGDMTALRNKFAETASAEQGQVASADEVVLQRLKAANDEYLEKFGFIFIVCATGKSAAEMLALLQERIGNSRQQELINGAREQGLITQLRINKHFEAN